MALARNQIHSLPLTIATTTKKLHHRTHTICVYTKIYIFIVCIHWLTFVSLSFKLLFIWTLFVVFFFTLFFIHSLLVCFFPSLVFIFSNIFQMESFLFYVLHFTKVKKRLSFLFCFNIKKIYPWDTSQKKKKLYNIHTRIPMYIKMQIFGLFIKI